MSPHCCAWFLCWFFQAVATLVVIFQEPMATPGGLGAAGEYSFGSASCLTGSLHYYRLGYTGLFISMFFALFFLPASPLPAPPRLEDGVRLDRDGFSLLACGRRVGFPGSEPRDGFSGPGFSLVVAAVCSMLLLDLPMWSGSSFGS